LPRDVATVKLPYERIRVIINPAAGRDLPILSVLNDVLSPAGVDWDVHITHGPGDATRLAEEAVAGGADLVAAYGGDGTQMEVANGLLGTGVPQAILPGGTGNAMALDLDIPLDVAKATSLLVTSPRRRAVDLARIGDRVFMLRAYAGVSSEQAASREEKNRLGQLAYLEAGLKFLTSASPTHYRASLDDRVIEADAIICYILNAGSIGGVLGIKLPPVGQVSVSDGYLDLYIVTTGIQPLGAIKHHIFQVGEDEGGIHHWRSRQITLEADPPQEVWMDGEITGLTPFTAAVLPAALEVVVPD
jgi:diacylglycerol kinase (ATP)